MYNDARRLDLAGLNLKTPANSVARAASHAAVLDTMSTFCPRKPLSAR